MDARDREKAQQEAIENMLGDALRRGGPPAREVCPEPHLMAAYFEQTLGPAEKVILESHISDCDHCQEVLAALATTALEPALAEEFVMAAASAMPAAKPQSARGFETARAPALRAPEATTVAKTSWFTLHWRWLTPAVSLAAVAVLWFAIGQPSHLPPRVDVAISTSKEAVPLPQAAEPAPKSEADRLATNLESPSPGRRQSSDFSNKKKPPLDPISRNSTGTADASAPGSALAEKASAAAPSAKPSGEPAAAPISPQNATAERSEFGKLADEKKESREAGARAVGGLAGNAAAPPAPAAPQSARQKMQQAPSQVPAQSQVADAPSTGTAPGFSMRDSEGRLKALRKTALPSVLTIVTPDPLILWRVGRDGTIERTNDGQTWRTQLSGASANLTSGSAPSANVCWVVGSAGIILRTTDGENWEKIAPPAPLDWIRIAAEDAQRAIVTSAGQKRYATTDGGRTWKAR